MRRLPGTLALLGVLAVTPLLSGCARDDIRIGRSTLEREAARSFHRSYGAFRQMTKGHYNEGFVNYAHAICHASTVVPRSAGVSWHWICAIRYTTRGGVTGQAGYGVRVDARGCFLGRSSDFYPRVRQIQLRRFAPNPLNVLHGCPDRFEMVLRGENDRD